MSDPVLKVLRPIAARFIQQHIEIMNLPQIYALFDHLGVSKENIVRLVATEPNQTPTS